MYIGIDIGGTHTRVAKGANGKIFDKKDFPTEDFDTTVNKIKTAIDTLSKDNVGHIGVSVAGPYNYKENTSLRSPNLEDPESWGNKNLSRNLSDNLGIPTSVAHDASVAALGEAIHGAGKGKDPVLYFTVSTGIGAGLIINKGIFHGVINPEVGHQIINKDGPRHPGSPAGDLEAQSSGSALERMYGKKSVDVEGSKEWEEAMEWLAIGLTNSILHFSPEIVVIGGGMTKHENVFFTPLNKYMDKYMKYVPKVPIVPSNLGQDNGLIGALELARQTDQNE
jgi:glucokinase